MTSPNIIKSNNSPIELSPNKFDIQENADHLMKYIKLDLNNHAIPKKDKDAARLIYEEAAGENGKLVSKDLETLIKVLENLRPECKIIYKQKNQTQSRRPTQQASPAQQIHSSSTQQTNSASKSKTTPPTESTPPDPMQSEFDKFKGLPGTKNTTETVESDIKGFEKIPVQREFKDSDGNKLQHIGHNLVIYIPKDKPNEPKYYEVKPGTKLQIKEEIKDKETLCKKFASRELVGNDDIASIDTHQLNAPTKGGVIKWITSPVKELKIFRKNKSFSTMNGDIELNKKGKFAAFLFSPLIALTKTVFHPSKTKEFWMKPVPQKNRSWGAAYALVGVTVWNVTVRPGKFLYNQAKKGWQSPSNNTPYQGTFKYTTENGEKGTITRENNRQVRVEKVKEKDIENFTEEKELHQTWRSKTTLNLWDQREKRTFEYITTKTENNNTKITKTRQTDTERLLGYRRSTINNKGEKSDNFEHLNEKTEKWVPLSKKEYKKSLNDKLQTILQTNIAHIKGKSGKLFVENFLVTQGEFNPGEFELTPKRNGDFEMIYFGKKVGRIEINKNIAGLDQVDQAQVIFHFKEESSSILLKDVMTAKETNVDKRE